MKFCRTEPDLLTPSLKIEIIIIIIENKGAWPREPLKVGTPLCHKNSNNKFCEIRIYYNT